MSNQDDKDFAIRAPYIQRIAELEAELLAARDLLSAKDEPAARICFNGGVAYASMMIASKDCVAGTLLYRHPVRNTEEGTPI